MHRFALTIVGILLSSFLFAQTPKWKKWEVQADTLMSREDFSGAAKYYTKSIKSSKLKEKEAFGALYKRAVAFYSMGQFPDALADINIFIHAYPQVHQAKLLRAYIFKGLGDDSSQLTDINELLGIQPDNQGLLKWRASLYLDQDEYEKALADAEAAREIEDDAEVEMYLGFALYNLGRAEEALASINRCIELDPNYLPAYLYAGSFCLEEEQYQRALGYLNIALQLEPQNNTAIFYKGIALAELGRVDEGCSCLRKAFYTGEDNAGDYLKEYCYGIEDK